MAVLIIEIRKQRLVTVHSSLLNMVLQWTPGITKGSDGK